MKIVQVKQNSPEWHAHRAQYFNASDAPAMMGVSPYKKRSQLLHERAGGAVAEVDAHTQKRFDDGHRFEALARPIAEEIIGEELFPCVGVEGQLSASFDGLTMDESVAWEHKTLNDELRKILVNGCDGRDLPLHYRVQMQQQCMVSGCEKVLFMASKFDADGKMVEERRCWYFSDPSLADDIIAGWMQFKADLADYKPEAASEQVVGSASLNLPTLSVELVGEVKASNLAVFKSTALQLIGSINTDLQTDQDFADAEAMVKKLEKAEGDLKGVKASALAQTQSIDDLFRAVDELSETVRQKRLTIDKLVKARKDTIRIEIKQTADKAFADHVATLNKRLDRVALPVTPPNFIEAMKGKKTLTSLRDAVDTELANSKIKTSAEADRIAANLRLYDEIAGAHEFLFRDLQSLVTKDADAMEAIVKQRISEHKEAEQKRLDAERERIRAEEQTRLESAVSQEPVDQQVEQLPSKLAVAGSTPTLLSTKRKRQARPTDRQIVDVLTTHFRVHDSKVIEWLLDMDLESVSTELAREM